ADYKEDFKVLLENELKKRGLILFKFRQTESTLFSQISDNNAKMSLEITRKNVKGTLKAYQKVNGNQIDVLTLRPEELLLEKMAAYNDRLKVRDIYDVYFLSRFVNDRNVKDSVKTYLSKIKKPVDENDLKAIIYEGKVPTFEEMLEVLNAWAR
ncbi:MAG: nucleotidyl transferase AbiEii/AbiGii toxin family protein, partial [Candidatus Parvarchaeum sp.]|nr:nucleotidyl transferase AbiEii/AbiGii toxin family protein [Candidatus Parvarchaeum tengchongense]